MIPYIHVPDLHIGPLPLHPFGILVATGVLVGTSVTTRRARTMGYDVNQLNTFVTWMLVSAFVLSHVLDSIFYHWDEVVRRPWSVLMLWEGLSSFGGFVGAAVGIFLWKYFFVEEGGWWPKRRPQVLRALPFSDLVLSVFPLGWMFGRAGCATVHDHPGARTAADTLLAVAYPLRPGEGLVTKIGFIELIHGHDPRFDLGFLELLFTILIAVAFALTWRRRLPRHLHRRVGARVRAGSLRDGLLAGAGEDGGDTRYGDADAGAVGVHGPLAYGVFMIFYSRRVREKDLTAGLRDQALERIR